MKFTSLRSATILLATWSCMLDVAHGGFVRQAGTDLGEAQDGSSFRRVYDWHRDGAQANPLEEGSKWITKLTETDTSIQVSTKHNVLTDPGPLFEGETLFTHLPDRLADRPVFSGSMFQQRHTPLADDFFSFMLRLAPTGAEEPVGRVTLGGQHIVRGLLGREFRASLTNPANSGETLRNITFTPDYTKYIRDPNTGEIIPDPDNPVVYGDPITPPRPTLAPGEGTQSVMPRIRRKDGRPVGELDFEKLSSYRVHATGSPATTTDLAFVGRVDGLLTEMDLTGGALNLFGEQEFIAPMLRDGDEARDLYVSIDLVKWLGFEGSFAPNQPFQFDNGVSPDLPGVMVSTSPFNFVPGSGFVAQDDPNDPNDGLFNGEAFAAAVIDGQVVPEPSTTGLAAAGCLSFACYVLWRRRRGAVLTTRVQYDDV